jgi:hypothetical protein
MFKYRICSECGSVAAGSENREYAYHCYGCDKDLYEFETEEQISKTALPPAIEGTKKDIGFKGFDYCDEMCSFCMEETFNIPVNRVSLCAHCSKEMFPCSVCDDDCSWKPKTLRCRKFNHTANYKKEYRKEYKKELKLIRQEQKT